MPPVPYFAPYLRANHMLPNYARRDPQAKWEMPTPAEPNDGDLIWFWLGDGSVAVFECDNDASTTPGNWPVTIPNPWDVLEFQQNLIAAFYSGNGAGHRTRVKVAANGLDLIFVNATGLGADYGGWSNKDGFGPEFIWPICVESVKQLEPFMVAPGYYPEPIYPRAYPVPPPPQ